MFIELRHWISDPIWRALLGFIVTLLAAFLVRWLVHIALGSLVRRTASDLDDQLYAIVRRPILLSLIMVGLYWIALDSLSASSARVAGSVLASAAVVVWMIAGLRFSSLTFTALSRRSQGGGTFQPRTVPAYDMLVKIALLGLSIYAVFVVWNIDLTAWLASAGILGVVVGFAAKDTLANLFAGLFITADAPYKVGDYIVIEGGLRGRVTHIGLRSTRILTRDDVEITIPNAVIGNSQIINEDGGPYIKQRIRVPVSVAYGSDIDEVRRVLLSASEGVDLLCREPEPGVRFRSFGGSGLEFELLVWIDNAHERGRILDRLHCNIYKAFGQANIEIPYSKHDVYIKQMPPVAGVG